MKLPINKIKIEKVIKEKFSKKCERCKKEISGVSLKQLNHNFNLHKIFCEKNDKNKSSLYIW